MVKVKRTATEQHRIELGIINGYIYLYNICSKEGQQGMIFSPMRQIKHAGIRSRVFYWDTEMRHWWMNSWRFRYCPEFSLFGRSAA